jgi:hypothetical protein
MMPLLWTALMVAAFVGAGYLIRRNTAKRKKRKRIP